MDYIVNITKYEIKLSSFFHVLVLKMSERTSTHMDMRRVGMKMHVIKCIKKYFKNSKIHVQFGLVPVLHVNYRDENKCCIRFLS